MTTPTKVHVTVISTFGSPTDRNDRRTIACMTAVDEAARHARDQLANHGGNPDAMRLIARQDADRDDDDRFTYYIDHTLTFSDHDDDAPAGQPG